MTDRRKAIKHEDQVFAQRAKPMTLRERFDALPELAQALLFVGFIFLVFAIAGTLTYPC